MAAVGSVMMRFVRGLSYLDSDFASLMAMGQGRLSISTRCLRYERSSRLYLRLFWGSEVTALLFLFGPSIRTVPRLSEEEMDELESGSEEAPAVGAPAPGYRRLASSVRLLSEDFRDLVLDFSEPFQVRRDISPACALQVLHVGEGVVGLFERVCQAHRNLRGRPEGAA